MTRTPQRVGYSLNAFTEAVRYIIYTYLYLLRYLVLKLYRVLHIWALFWMLTMIILLKLEKEFYWLTSAFMD